jgi:hypothetical protein
VDRTRTKKLVAQAVQLSPFGCVAAGAAHFYVFRSRVLVGKKARCPRRDVAQSAPTAQRKCLAGRPS